MLLHKSKATKCSKTQLIDGLAQGRGLENTEGVVEKWWQLFSQGVGAYELEWRHLAPFSGLHVSHLLFHSFTVKKRIVVATNSHYKIFLKF